MDAKNIINSEILIDIYELMLKIRITEETIAEKYSEWEMRCPTHLSIGQEAVSSAVGKALRTDDYAVSTHRSHGHYLGKNGNLKKMIAEIYGKSTGCSSGLGGSMHLIDKSVGFMGSTAIVGGTIPVGVGLGLSIKLKKTDQVSCIFFGDGAVEEGVFYESVNFAVLKNLPVLFICENNLYSVYSPLSVRQPEGRKIHKMVEGMGITTIYGDGNNAVEVYHKVKTGLESIRRDNKPLFFEFDTYRWREHCGPNYDNDIGYRTEDEFQTWKKRDPVEMMKKYLLKENIAEEPELEKIDLAIKKEIDEAFLFAKNSSFPEKDILLNNLYRD